MNRRYTLISRWAFVIALLFMMSSHVRVKPKKILVFSKTAGFRHTAAIDAGKKVIPELGATHKFDVDLSEDASVFTPDNLKQYAAVVFLCTTGNALDDHQQVAFQQFIRSGGGFVGLHSATDTEYDWPWYGELVGAYFKNHPRGQQEAAFTVVDANTIATRHLPAVWKRTDELYNFKWIAPGLHVLITVDENSYTGGGNGDYHPMCWYHNFDGGRAFYTALGHDMKSYDDPLYRQHILGGIEYAMGKTLTANVKYNN